MNKKALARISISVFLVVSVVLLLMFVGGVFADGATIWTTDIDGNPKDDFIPDEIVYIHGEGFLEGSNIDVDVTRPDNNVDSGSTTSEAYGTFVYEYDLNGIEGFYMVKATDGKNSAETYFGDHACSYCQPGGYCDGDADGYAGNQGLCGLCFICCVPIGDCDDSDADVNPGATEVCDNLKDDDCDGDTDCDDSDCDGDPACQLQICGNGQVEGTEECDDGNTDDGDCCSSTCEYESSGSACGEARDCSDDQCDGSFAEFYPDDGHDTCDGAGNCVEYSCTMETSYCTDNDNSDGINTLECGASCDQDSDCDPYLEGDTCYYDGICDLEVDCECDYSEDDCPEPGTIYEGDCYYGERHCVNSANPSGGCTLNVAPMDCYDTCDPVQGPIDTIGPDTSNLVATKISEICMMNVEATETDSCSNIAAAEYFLGGSTCGDEGTGTLMDAKDGAFDELIEDVIKNNVAVSDGSLNVHVRGKDAANNWGPCETIRVDIDCSPPGYPTDVALNGVVDADELLICGIDPLLTANICDDQSRIQLAEYFIDEDNPINWLGIYMGASDGEYDELCEDVEHIIDISGLSEGTHYVQLHGKDGYENWGKFVFSPIVSFIKDITAPETDKVLNPAGGISVSCDIQTANGKTITDGCYYVKHGTAIDLTATDPDPQGTGEFAGDVVIHYKVWWSEDCETDWELRDEGEGEVDEDVEITLDEDSCHLIEYWAEDLCENEEEHHFELDIVDTQAPETTKIISEPKYWDEQNQKLYIDGATLIELTCIDPDPHPVNDVTIYYRYRVDDCSWPEQFTKYTGELTFPEESKHELEYYCIDALGNEEQHQFEIDYVDHTKPVTTKTYGMPYYTDGISKWITSRTPITLTADDGDENHDSGVAITLWRNTLVDDIYCLDPVLCEMQAEGLGPFIEYIEPFYKPEESCHLIEYYSIDNVDKTETIHKQCVFVENTPPVSTKEIIGPQYYDGATGKTYIDGATKIKLTCEDPEPHPVDDVTIYYRYIVSKEGVAWPEQFTEYTGQFSFPEESKHELEYYCIDALGNEEKHQFEIDYVDHTPPVTTKTYGEPYYSDGISKWITSQTPIKLTADDGDEDHDSGVAVTYWRNTLVDDALCRDDLLCKEVQGEGEFIEYIEPFFKPEESCHLIEYYSIDNVEKTEVIKKQCVFVENTPPEGIKIVGEPKIAEGGLEELVMDDNPESPTVSVTKTWDCAKVIWDFELEDQGDPFCDYGHTEFGLVIGDANNHAVFHISTGQMHGAGSPPIIKEWNGGWSDTMPLYDGIVVTNPGGTDGVGYGDRVFHVEIPMQYLNGGDFYWALTTYGGQNYGYCKSGYQDYPDTWNKWSGTGIYADAGLGDCWVRDHVTPITLDCKDPEPHPVDNEKMCYRISFDEPSTPYLTGEYCSQFGGTMEGDECCVEKASLPYTFTFMEDSLHDLEYYCEDALGNKDEVDIEWFKVDSIPPVTTKTYVGPLYEEGGLEWIDGVTTVKLKAEDGGEVCAVGIDEIRYRVSGALADRFCENCADWMTSLRPDMGPWQTYGDPFGIDQESCHVIEYSSVDLLGNEEEIQWQCVFVDKTKPVTTKWYEGPQYPIDDVYPKWITSETDVILSAADPEPHPSGVAATFYRDIYLENPQDWNYCYTDLDCKGHVPIPPPEPMNPDRNKGWEKWTGEPFHEEPESCHIIEYYSVDNVGKVEDIKWQCVFVENTPPVSSKELGEPEVECSQEDFEYYGSPADGCYYITQATEITLTCSDIDPHPVDDVKIYYRDYIPEGDCSGDVLLTCDEIGGFGEYKCLETDGCDWIVDEYCDGTPQTNACGNYNDVQCLSIPGCDLVPELVNEYCIGTPALESCYELGKQFGQAKCIETPGCEWVVYGDQDQFADCNGDISIDACYPYDEDQCDLIPGCDWIEEYEDECKGTPDSCSEIKDEFKCVLETPGCEWVAKEDCEGIVQDDACDPYNYFQCTRIDGCTWTPTGLPGFTEVIGTEITFTKDEDSEHILEWYCVDALGNKEDDHYEIDIVDTKKPITTKTVGDPKVVGDGFGWWVTSSTPFKLSCVDPEPHPVDDVIIWYKYKYDGKNWKGPFEYTGEPDKLPKEGFYYLEYWCIDALGNMEDHQFEEDVVDNQCPIIDNIYPPDETYIIDYTISFTVTDQGGIGPDGEGGPVGVEQSSITVTGADGFDPMTDCTTDDGGITYNCEFEDQDTSGGVHKLVIEVADKLGTGCGVVSWFTREADVTITSGDEYLAIHCAGCPPEGSCCGMEMATKIKTKVCAAGGFTIPDGKTVTFETTLGRFMPPIPGIEIVELGPEDDDDCRKAKITFDSGFTTGTATVTATADGDSDSVDIELFTCALGAIEATAEPASITADGVSTSTITVQLKDDLGNNLNQIGTAINIVTTAGTLAETTILTDATGKATTTLTSSTSVVTATVIASVGTLSDLAEVEFVTIPFNNQIELIEDEWKLISIPRPLDDNSFNAVFEPDDLLLYYDAGWNLIDTTSVPPDDAVAPLWGYWAISQDDDTTVNLVYDDEPMAVPPQRQLVAGWNLIGYGDIQSRPIEIGLSSIQGKYELVLKYDNGWKIYTPLGGSDFNTVDPAVGYWVFMKEEGLLAGTI